MIFQLNMKIYDCFMFFDEEMLLDLRLNVMDKYVNKFVITEATYMHSGKPKKLVFDINKFSKFKNKIIYHVVDNMPLNIEPIYDNDSYSARAEKLINKYDIIRLQIIQKFLCHFSLIVFSFDAVIN